MNKYEKFFEELIEIHLRVNLWKRLKVEEATKTELLKFGEEIEKEFGLGMMAYLRYFGKGPYTNGGVFKYSYSCIRQAIKEIKKKEIYKGERELNLSAGNRKTISISKVCFVSFLDYNGNFTLMLQEEENPSLYFGEGYDNEFDLLATKLTNSIRNEVFNWIRQLARIKFDKTGKTNYQSLNIHSYEIAGSANFSSLDWVNYYKNNRVKNIFAERKGFEKIMNKEEVNENKIIGFDEFENRFVEYLESRK